MTNKIITIVSKDGSRKLHGFDQSTDLSVNLIQVLELPTGYVCLDAGRGCFKRGSHEQIIKAKGITTKNITMEWYYNGAF